MRYRDTTGAFNPPPQRVLTSDVADLAPLPAGRSRVSLREVTPRTVAQAAALLNARFDVELAVWEPPSLAFLTDLPPLCSLKLNVDRSVRALDPLVAHADYLQILEVHTHLSTLDVSGLVNLRALRQLYLHNGQGRILGAPEGLAGVEPLEHLVLHSVTIPDLTPLQELPRLRGLALKLGGTHDLSGLSGLKALRFFEAWQVRGLVDLEPLAVSPMLEVLYLQSLRRAALPNLASATNLAHVQLDHLPLADGLTGLASAPALRQLWISRSRRTSDEVRAFLGHPTLQAALIHGTWNATEERDEVLGLPGPHNAPWVAYAAGGMGLPPVGWDGQYWDPANHDDS